MGAHANGLVLRTVGVNWNDDGWNVNANALGNNQWNDDNRIFSRYYCGSPVLLAGVLFSMPRFQPQSILPISASFTESSSYCFVERFLVSQRICKKNFNVSNFAFAFWSSGNFCSGLRY